MHGEYLDMLSYENDTEGYKKVIESYDLKKLIKYPKSKLKRSKDWNPHQLSLPIPQCSITSRLYGALAIGCIALVRFLS